MALYTIHPYLARPTFSPPGRFLHHPQTVAISDISTKTIYYTTDGIMPTTSSTPLLGADYGVFQRNQQCDCRFERLRTDSPRTQELT
ncbi:MAG: chitobiase/beta-hexosaminidase C-terminal domain-containing protein [Silvibacterium sp.]|jgi:hypothetical protein